ncbi:MAG: LysR-family transcriptional regulator [Nocardioidaceae bacterium]|nr:LysR-family transcriptional regulator [Nocardioidaceae bacterium]
MSSRVPDLPALRLLVAVAREGSIGAAARTVGVTQQAASERLRGVEAQVGVTLVRRGARGSELTPDGVVVVEWAARLLDLADEIDHALDGLRSERTRELDVWSSMTVAESLLPRWLVLLRQRQESAGLRPSAVSLTAANSTQVLEAVRAGTAHVGFVEGADVPVGVRSRGVGRDVLVLVAAAGAPLARRRTPVPADEIAAMALTSRERGSGTREVVDRALARHDLTATDPVVELSTATAVRGAVLAGGAPAFLSRRVVSRDLDAGLLVEVPTRDLALERTFRAVWTGTAEPPAGPVRDLVGIARAST